MGFSVAAAAASSFGAPATRRTLPRRSGAQPSARGGAATRVGANSSTGVEDADMVGAELRRDGDAAPTAAVSPCQLVGPSSAAVGGGALFCFGLGYTSLGLVRTLARAGWRVAGTCRDDDRRASLAASGVEAHVWRPDDGVGLSPAGMAALMGATHVLSSVPPVGDFDQDPVLADAACAGALVAAAAMGSSGRFPAQVDDTPSPSSSFPPSSSPDFSLPSSSSMLSPAPPSPLPATSPGQDLPTLSPRLRWVGYLSSTGVYGDRGGGWVDEDTAPCPASPKGVARYVAEEAWRDMCELHGVPVVVFRLGGIYGPGRSMLDTVAARARASAGPRTHPASGAESRSQRARGSRKFTSRCHVGDVVAVLCASIARTAEIAVAEEVVEAAAAVEEAAAVLSSAPPPSFSSAPATSRVYNVVDDEPAPRADAAAFARILLQLPLDDADADAGVDASGTGGNGVESARGEKRVRNDRIKGELGVRLRYPTYREGLAAIADGDRTPFF